MLAISVAGESGAVEAGLNPGRCCPRSYSNQGGRDTTPLARLLSAIESGQDRGIERHRSGMIADARHRQGGRTTGVSRRVHQSGSRPIRRDVKAGLIGVWTIITISCNVPVNQTRIDCRDSFIGQVELFTHVWWVIDDKHIGPTYQPAQ